MELTMITAMLGILLAFQWMNKKNKKKLQAKSEEHKKMLLSDESVFKSQIEFETRLEKNIDLPDSVHGKASYIYNHLMRPWFSSLLVANRYSEEMSEKIKTDLLDYMKLLERQKGLSWLSFETEDESKSYSYWLEAATEHRQIELIEDAVAASIGKEAIEQLKLARSKSDSAFDKFGNDLPGHKE